MVYEAQPRQAEFHYSPATFRLFGGQAGPGKSHAILFEAILQAAEWPGVYGALFRRTYPELRETLVERAFQHLPKGSYRWDSQRHVITLPHPDGQKSEIRFAYCQYEKDVYDHQGIEYDFIGIDELTHWPERMAKYLITRLRTSIAKTDINPNFFAATNPGNVGHAWVKRLWIDHRLLPEELQAFDIDEFEFIRARLEDNRYLGEEYKLKLMMLPEMERRMLLEGDWDVFAGQYFSEWRRDLHVCEPFEIPKEWTRIISIDYGYSPRPSAVYWHALSPAGGWYIYRELVVLEHTYTKLAKATMDATPATEDIEYLVADPSTKGQLKPAAGESGLETLNKEFEKRKWQCRAGDSDRIAGARRVREWMQPIDVTDGHGQTSTISRLQIFSNCTKLIESIPTLIHDMHKPEDVDSEGDDDPYDSIRYAMMSRPAPRQMLKPKKEILDRYGAPTRRSRPSFGQRGDARYRPVVKLEYQPRWRPR